MQLRPVGRFRSIEDVVQRTGLRRDELTTLADIGALNEFTNERRSALWQVERAVRPAGALFVADDEPRSREDAEQTVRTPRFRVSAARDLKSVRPMTDDDRLQADYAGTGLTIGPHPMALRRGEMSLRGVLRAVDLPNARNGRRVRVAGMVITRQRPGTAKGFVFLTLEDETGISNVIVRPDLFDRQRMTVVRQPFLIVDGVLQHQDGVVSVRAERVEGMTGGASVDAHDFYLNGRPEGRPLPMEDGRMDFAGSLAGKTALVTGASRGIGRGIAVALADAGARVYATGRSIDSATLPDAVTRIACDHNDDDAVAQVFGRIQSECGGRLDVLANAVWGGYERMVENGKFTWGIPFWEQPLWRWSAMMDAGVRAGYVASQHAARLMVPARGGRDCPPVALGGAKAPRQRDLRHREGRDRHDGRPDRRRTACRTT